MIDEARARRPLVAIAYGPRSVAPMQLAEAAAPICDLLWVVDAELPEVAEMQTLLRQLGGVVDVPAMDPATAAREIAPFRPDGIVTYFDTGMVEIAQLAAALQLPFASPQAAVLLVDKLRQRDALRAAGLTVPRYWALSSTSPRNDLAAFAREVRWPAVLKPRSETGSHNQSPALPFFETARLP